MEHNTKKHIEIKFDGSKLRDIMYKHDLTPMTFSKKIGLSQPAISHWLCGRNRPSRKALDKLNDYFHVTDEYWKKGVTGAFTPTVAAEVEELKKLDTQLRLMREIKAKDTEIQGLKCELEGLKVENARLDGVIAGLTHQQLPPPQIISAPDKEPWYKRWFA